MDDLRANPAPLGLMAFGMAMVLWSLHNAGLFALDDVVVAMGLCYSAVALVIAGIMAFRRNDTISMTAFTSYGLFWLSLVYIILAGNSESWTLGSNQAFLGWFFALWGIFTAAMFLGALHRSRALQGILIALTATYALLAVGAWIDQTVVTEIAGYVGLVCAALAVYLAVAEIALEVLRREVLPVGVYRGPRPSRRYPTRIDEMPPLEPTVPHPLDDNLPDFED